MPLLQQLRLTLREVMELCAVCLLVLVCEAGCARWPRLTGVCRWLRVSLSVGLVSGVRVGVV